MGGAFSAIADDATAALANPAGLGLISSIEIAVSGKRVDETLALATARSVATGSLVAPYPPVQTSSVGLDASTTGVEFAGVVVPISRRFVAAITYAENLRFEGDAGAGGYQYLELRDNRSGGSTRRDFSSNTASSARRSCRTGSSRGRSRSASPRACGSAAASPSIAPPSTSTATPAARTAS